MPPDRTVLLDNEAVQALTDPRHRKHRRVLAILEADLTHHRRARVALSVSVPTTVRVEAGWDRRSGGTAHLGRVRVIDIALDSALADTAAGLRPHNPAVADLHLAAALTVTAPPHVILSSDPAHLEALAGRLNLPVRVVRL